ncbi:MAG: NAD(P)/FAD-dependent oxidoreductase [Oscillospiraceae bacterium]|nr:NAD(P)/FAD-dependent oxidoreductase [Oscillospiraceae bacterium]
MKILVAGAGHGGLAAAGILARSGCEVAVLERGPEHNLGHDWTDIFNMRCFGAAGIPMPGEGTYHRVPDFTFHNPARTVSVTAPVPEERSEMGMERRDLLRHLIRFARENGAALEFGTTVEKPLIEGGRVVGLAVKDKAGRRELAADLVIDAAGMDSPVRRGLPEAWGLTGAFRRDQYFTVYRAFYSRTDAAPLSGEPFNVYFYPLGRRAVAWAAREDDYVDLLCGSFGDTTREYAGEVRQSLLGLHPEFGGEVLRGGQVVKLPVRRPVSVMVADGYAAVGDSAGMTVPIIGSGISNSIRAAKMLADVILAARDFSAASLWPYQAEYMRRIGAVHACLDPLKAMLLTMEPGALDFLFERRVLDAADLAKARTGQEVNFTPAQMAVRGLRGAARLPTLLKMAGTLSASRKLKRHALSIPARYDGDAVRAWARAYDAIS